MYAIKLVWSFGWHLDESGMEMDVLDESEWIGWKHDAKYNANLIVLNLPKIWWTTILVFLTIFFNSKIIMS